MTKPRRVAIMLDMEWPYKRHASVFTGTQQYAQEHDWDSVIDEYASHTLLRKSTIVSPYDGIIARATRKLARGAARWGVPVVNVWYSSPARRSVPGVFADFKAIGQQLAEHLLSRGFHRFASLIEENDHAQSLIHKAIARAAKKAGAPSIVQRVPLRWSGSLKNWLRTERTIHASMKDWQPPIGVYVGSEQGGRMVAQICRSRGWRVPDDVAIIAGWNEEIICERLEPTLTSIDVGYERIGYEAARLLDRLMSGNRPPAGPILIASQRLVVRASTDFFAVEDKLIAAALSYIAANSHLPIGPEDVAEATNTTKRTLARHFIKQLGRPIAAEIRRGRIERAKRELLDTEKTVKEVARSCGFGGAVRLYKVFVREVGLTPIAFRQQQRVRLKE